MIIRVFDKTGSWIADHNAATDRSLLLNDAGKCLFTLPAINDKGERVLQETVEYGRYIYIEDDYLPAWAGQIKVPRTWGGYGIQINARSAEYLFNNRILPPVETYKGSPGAIFTEWIEEANKDEDQLLREGEIYGGGTSREEESNMALIFPRLKTLAAETKEDFGVEPAFDAFGKLYFKCNWYKKRGVTDIQPLRQGEDLVFSNPELDEQGNPEHVTCIIGYGDGANFSTRPRHKEIDQTAKARYGLFEFPKYYPGKKGTALAEAVKNDLKIMRNPRKVTKIEIGERRTDVTGRLRLGNVMYAEYFEVGFSENGYGATVPIRTKGIAHNENKHLVTVSVDEEYDV